MKKIAYITHYAPFPSTNADSICVMETCSAIAKLGYKLNLIIPSHSEEAIKITEEREIWDFYGLDKSFEITQLTAKPFYRFGFLGRFIYKAWSILVGVRNKSDLLYLRHVETALIAGILGRKTLLAHHDLSFIENWWALRFLVSAAKKGHIYFLSVTNAGAEILRKLGVAEKQILVAPNGVDLKQFHFYHGYQEGLREKLQLPTDKTIVVYSGSLYEGRGIEELIEGMRAFPKLLLVVVGGDDKDIRRCKNAVEIHHQDNIIFIGPVLPKIVPQYLLAADMLVMPYTTNTPTHKAMSPMKMFDYMASGNPIISSDFPVLREILTDKINSVLVEPGSSRAIIEGIQWVLDNPEKAKEIGLMAKEDVNDFTWEKRAKKITSWIFPEST